MFGNSAKFSKNGLAFAAGLMLVTAAHASQQSGRVYSLHVRDSDGLVYVVLEGSNRTAKPACAAGNYFVIRSETSNSGRQQLALLLAAKTAGRTIYITGTGVCSRWNDGEDIGAVAIAD